MNPIRLNGMAARPRDRIRPQSIVLYRPIDPYDHLYNGKRWWTCAPCIKAGILSSASHSSAMKYYLHVQDCRRYSIGLRLFLIKNFERILLLLNGKLYQNLNPRCMRDRMSRRFLKKMKRRFRAEGFHFIDLEQPNGLKFFY